MTVYELVLKVNTVVTFSLQNLLGFFWLQPERNVFSAWGEGHFENLVRTWCKATSGKALEKDCPGDGTRRKEGLSRKGC